MANINEYLERIADKDSRFELKKFDEKHFEYAKDSFIQCCKSIVPEWKDVHPNVTENIVRYIVQSDKFEGDLNKGLLLMGKTGTGKTVYLKSLALMMGYTNNFKFKIYTGFDMEHIYQLDSNNMKVFNLEQALKSKMFGIDDLGEEHTTIKRYGTEINVGIDTLTKRHRAFTDNGYLTFATSNLNSTTLANKYGARIESRVHEMFNLIGVKGEDLRKT